MEKARHDTVEVHLLTGEQEAREEYRMLRDRLYAIYYPARGLNFDELTEMIGVGEDIQIRLKGCASGDMDRTMLSEFRRFTLISPEAAFSYLEEVGYEAFVHGNHMSEDEFVAVARSRGTVDLERVSMNPKTDEPFLDKTGEPRVERSYRTSIGWTSGPVVNLYEDDFDI